MTIQHSGYPLPISQQLTAIIDRERQAYDDRIWLGFFIYFRDPHANAENGGYHPVEIAVDAQDRIKTLTAYGRQDATAGLTKELDVDFFYQRFWHRGTRYPIESGVPVFDLWQRHFCAHYEQHVYEVTLHGL